MQAFQPHAHLAFNPGATKIVKAIALAFPGVTEIAVRENISLRLEDRDTRAFVVTFAHGGTTHAVSVRDTVEGALADCTSATHGDEIARVLWTHFGDGNDNPVALPLDLRDTMMSSLEERLASAESVPLRRIVYDISSFNYLLASLDHLVMRGEGTPEPGTPTAVADDIRKALAEASPGAWIGVDGRHLKTPADCTDYAVVSPESCIEVARVWNIADVRYLAATSPDKIAVLLDAFEAGEKRDERQMDDLMEFSRTRRDDDLKIAALERRIETLQKDPATVIAIAAEVHDGWKHVPAVPTPEMIEAADRAGAKAWHTREHMATVMLQAAFDAAPPVPEI